MTAQSNIGKNDVLKKEQARHLQVQPGNRRRAVLTHSHLEKKGQRGPLFLNSSITFRNIYGVLQSRQQKPL
jgi:hypothetical protein